MKYEAKEFTIELKEKITHYELALKDLIANLITEHKSVFTKKGLKLDAGFDKEGDDPFHPGYSSSISIGISVESSELIDLHIIKIWECSRYFLGMPVSKKIPGSKIAGELVDESFADLKLELKEYIEAQLISIVD